MTTTQSTTTPLTVTDLLTGWGRLWSGELDLAPALVTSDFSVRFGNPTFAADGDAVRGPDALAAFVGAFRTGREGLRYVTRLARSAPGHAVSVWAADDDAAGLHVGGIDLLDLAPDGRARRVWSVTAGRPVAADDDVAP
ncbi:hypothetical protein AAG589_09455 [Isoptericola sp. F-RaC21]|uniref:hypothetical protein n=1 Tax=Isoptericola sp. F-RaC21 TaxID=3141452 RepID=UPI00315BE909